MGYSRMYRMIELKGGKSSEYDAVTLKYFDIMIVFLRVIVISKGSSCLFCFVCSPIAKKATYDWWKPQLRIEVSSILTLN